LKAITQTNNIVPTMTIDSALPGQSGGGGLAAFLGGE
jgi:hypothetical protein